MRLSIDPAGLDRHSAALYDQKKRAAELRELLRRAAEIVKSDPLVDYRKVEKSLELASRLEKSIRDKEELLNSMSDKARRVAGITDEILGKGE